MTKILDLGAEPVLGRVHAINRKHRLRSKHYAEIDDWPETGATVDVLDAAALDTLDFYPNRDQVFLCSPKLLGALRAIDDDVQWFDLDAGGRTVHLVLPLSDGDVMYESDGYPEYSKSGYNVVDGQNLRVNEQPDAAFCEVRNTGLLAISDGLAAAEVEWTLQDLIEHYAPFRRHPYFIYDTGYACAHADQMQATSDWPTAPDQVPHPLGSGVRDENLKGDPDEAWTKRIHRTESADDCAFTRYCCGFDLPAFAAQLDDDYAKSKRKKRWKETLAAGCLNMEGLPCVSAEIRDALVAAGVEAEFNSVPVSESTLEESTEFFLMTPRHVVNWIDWSGSDVGLLWSGIHDEYFDLQPTDESYAATIPVVRVAGSNLVLVHESIADLLSEDAGFYLRPLHECATSRNLDDCMRATR